MTSVETRPLKHAHKVGVAVPRGQLMCCNFSMGDSLLPVTALEYVPVGNGEILLAGEFLQGNVQLQCSIILDLQERVPS